MEAAMSAARRSSSSRVVRLDLPPLLLLSPLTSLVTESGVDRPLRRPFSFSRLPLPLEPMLLLLPLLLLRRLLRRDASRPSSLLPPAAPAAVTTPDSLRSTGETLRSPAIASARLGARPLPPTAVAPCLRPARSRSLLGGGGDRAGSSPEPPDRASPLLLTMSDEPEYAMSMTPAADPPTPPLAAPATSGGVGAGGTYDTGTGDR